MLLRDQPTTMERDAKACPHDGRDRISELPDAILHYILSKSSLNMEDVVRTCVLSKRWRNLWASMPHLAFNNSGSRFLSDTNLTEKEKDDDFTHFVSTSLLLRDAMDVQRFRLKWSCVGEFHEHTPKHLTTWMNYAVKHNVKELKVSAFIRDMSLEQLHIDKKPYELPRSVFTCPFLEYLNIYMAISGRDVSVPDVVSRRRLTWLQLDVITISSISLKALMYGCPVLKYVAFYSCDLQDPDFSSNSLKITCIDGCQISGTTIRIAGPNLETLFFNFNDFEKMEVLLENLPSLIEATIQAADHEAVYSDSTKCRPLRLTSPRIEGLSGTELAELRIFRNLKKLTLDGTRMVKNFLVVIHFLQHSPNLELLTLTTADGDLEAFSWFPCPHVKTNITISCNEDNDRITNLLTEFFSSKCGCFRE